MGGSDGRDGAFSGSANPVRGAAGGESVLEGLTGNRRAMVERRTAQIPRRLKGVYLRAVSGKSRTAAVHAHCYECIGWVRGEVKKCTAEACALYPYRPEK